MNVFILGTGRCGTTTFIQACQHINNYTASHESRSCFTGEQRLDYAGNHIEADNRLSWFLGRLDEKYENNAFYVHLTRALDDTVASFSKRESFGIMKAYKEGLLLGGQEKQSAKDISLDYINTVNANIRCFLKDKKNVMSFTLENALVDYEIFWNMIDAKGDLQAGLREWAVLYNRSF